MKLTDLIPKPTPLLGDNDPATRLIWNDNITDGNQFFWREYHFSKECYEAGLITPLRIESKLNIADIFTKSLIPLEIKRLSQILCGYIRLVFNIPPQPRGLHRVNDDTKRTITTTPNYDSMLCTDPSLPIWEMQQLSDRTSVAHFGGSLVQ